MSVAGEDPSRSPDPWAPQVPGEPGVLWPKDRSVRTDDGAELAYTFLGSTDGPVVALCAGLLSPDTWWYHLAPALAGEGYRVLVFNYRGIAGSSGPDPDHPEAYTIARFAEDLETIVTAEGIAQLSLVGHSMGVQVALEAYRRMAIRVRALIAITGPFTSPLRSYIDRGIVATALHWPMRLALGLTLPRVRRMGWRMAWTRLPAAEIGRAIRAYGPRMDARLLRDFFLHVADIDPATALRVVVGMHAHQATDVLDEVTAPVLFIAGGRDPMAPPADSERMATAVADATLRVVPLGTHGTIVEYPELVNGWVLDFLARHVPARAAQATLSAAARPR